jgi:hypothetical protein
MSSQSAVFPTFSPTGSYIRGYGYNTATTRDTSDYASYKKQIRIRNDSNIKKTNDLGFIKGTGMLLDYREGGYKSGPTGSTAPTCTSCNGNAFIGLTGPIGI